jgi:hypothetical protein
MIKNKSFYLKNVSGNNYIIYKQIEPIFFTERHPWPKKGLARKPVKNTNVGNVRKEKN